MQASNNNDATPEKTESPNQHVKVYLHGVRLWLVACTCVLPNGIPKASILLTSIYCRLAIMVFQVVLEILIIPTSLVSVSNDIGGFDDLSWVISSYLLGRVGTSIMKQ